MPRCPQLHHYHRHCHLRASQSRVRGFRPWSDVTYCARLYLYSDPNQAPSLSCSPYLYVYVPVDSAQRESAH
ncbi:hypothetical protein LY78DRAFT_655704 [Colletotrichum sublineola]|nr:hypothetical protein LY78DRAFT_655704 [Colletotrichum sublineola]